MGKIITEGQKTRAIDIKWSKNEEVVKISLFQVNKHSI